MGVTWWQPLKNTTAEETSSEDDSPGSTMESDSSGTIMSIWKWTGHRGVVHTIQLVVHMLQKETTVKRVLDKARSVVKLFRKSSIATQRLLDQCGVIVVNDYPTRWSSTFNMVTRLLTVKDAVCQISNDMGWDNLLTNSTDEKFSALAAAACFVNPTVCEILVNVDVADGNIQELLKQAEDYVVKCTFPHTRQEDQSEDDAEEEVIEEPEAAPSSKQPVFRFLSKCRTTRSKQKTSTTSIRQQIIKYKEELSHPITEDTGTDFWLAKRDSFYHSLKPFALDLLAMPASQALAERVFSITGDLTRGRRNRGRVTLERSAFLKMNRDK
ncbi:unnamed protein product [Leuciscus chuanchicus]